MLLICPFSLLSSTSLPSSGFISRRLRENRSTIHTEPDNALERRANPLYRGETFGPTNVKSPQCLRNDRPLRYIPRIGYAGFWPTDFPRDLSRPRFFLIDQTFNIEQQPVKKKVNHEHEAGRMTGASRSVSWSQRRLHQRHPRAGNWTPATTPMGLKNQTAQADRRVECASTFSPSGSPDELPFSRKAG